MTDSLVASKILQGKTRDEVLQLLGEPTAGDTSGTLTYCVDIGKRLSNGELWLFYLSVPFDGTTQKANNAHCHD